MIQGKSHHAESRAKTRKSSAAQNRIQGKTTKVFAAVPSRRPPTFGRRCSLRHSYSRQRGSLALAAQRRAAVAAEPGGLATIPSSSANGAAA